MTINNKSYEKCFCQEDWLTMDTSTSFLDKICDEVRPGKTKRQKYWSRFGQWQCGERIEKVNLFKAMNCDGFKNTFYKKCQNRNNEL